MRVKYRVCSHGKCLPPETRIATPLGDVPVSELRVGGSIWTLDDSGNRIAGIVMRTSSTVIDGEHHVVRITLADGRMLVASPAHPLVGGVRVGDVATGDRYDGSTVVAVERVKYMQPRTYDVLPSGTGAYWADGVLVRSTLE